MSPDNTPNNKRYQLLEKIKTVDDDVQEDLIDQIIENLDDDEFEDFVAELIAAALVDFDEDTITEYLIHMVETMFDD